MTVEEFSQDMEKMLLDIQSLLLQKNKSFREEHTYYVDSYDEFKSEYTGNIYFYTTDTLRIEVSGGFGAWNGDNDSLQLTFSDAGGYGKGFATMVVMNRDNTEAVLVLKIPVKME